MAYLKTISWMLSGAVCAAVLAAPRPAQACGGTFCDVGPTAMPVDQTGENILFVMEDGAVEAHIQIQYTGDPARFAWVIPVMSRPTLTAGSQALFDELLRATVPTFQLNTTVADNCQVSDPIMGCGFAASDDAADGGGLSGGFEDDEAPDGPDVVERGTVGSFEYAVLEGGSAAEVITWLDDNGFQQDPDAEPILDRYLSDDFLFVAIKLQAGAGLDEIHPLVVRYEGDEPCVPVELTRIAASPDMGIRTFFLGDQRMVPTNFRHVEWNLAALDWVNLGSNYTEVVTQAVDVPGSDGHGFVTEYAGASDVLFTDMLWPSPWNPGRFDGIPPTSAVAELTRQGLVSCDDFECLYNHPLVKPVLEEFLPVPDGLNEGRFYNCVTCFEDQIDMDAWDSEGFAGAMRERVFDPAQRALDITRQHPYLTRMFTTLSPGEMTRDPIFHGTDDLGDVPNVITAQRLMDCEGPDVVTLPDGRRVALDAGNWPTFDGEMVAASYIEALQPGSGPAEIADLDMEIDAVLQTWNDSQGLDEGCSCRVGRGYGGTIVLAMFAGLFGLRRRRFGSRRRLP